jgi:hypothetical protein
MSTSKSTPITKHVICAALDGVAKNKRTISSKPRVSVEYEKSKNPDPRVCIPGGLTKMDTSCNTHQRKVIKVKNAVKKRRIRTLQRLYGDTYNDLVLERYTRAWFIGTTLQRAKGGNSQLGHQGLDIPRGLQQLAVEADESFHRPLRPEVAICWTPHWIQQSRLRYQCSSSWNRVKPF